MAEEIKCDVCSKTFKTTQALAGHLQGPCGEQPGGALDVTRDTKALVKVTPLDLAVEKLRVPMVPAEFNGQANIYWSGFNEGVRYGANTVLAGIRSAQELSSLGIAQATPIIKMAQEMRQAEGQAAQALASEFAQATLESNREIIAAIKSQEIASSPNPMMTMMTQGMAPMFQQAMGSLMKMFQPKAGQPQPGPDEQPVNPQQEAKQQPAQQGYQQASIGFPPIEKHTLGEWEEE